MILAAITDRRSLDGELPTFLKRLLAAGVDSIQIREKDLEAGELLELCRLARRLPNPCGTKLLVNSRADVALAADLDGVHLPADSLPIPAVRSLAPKGFVVGKSCHSIDDLRQAEQDGADYAYFSPVFPSTSKPQYGPPVGLGLLEKACSAVGIPVLALGGVSAQNAADCGAAGAAGVAGISLFQQVEDLTALVGRLRGKP